MKVVKKAFTILELFLDHGDDLSLDEISRLTGFNKPTTRRIALGLIECGYMRQRVRRGKYSLGMKFLDFSGTIKMHNSIVRVVTPYMMELIQQINESVTMAIWDGKNTAHCQYFLADHPLKVVPEEGTKMVYHATSIGKAMIAELADQEILKYLDLPLKRFTPNTITDLDNLIRHLNVIRREGIAFDDEEYNLGVRGVGAAFKNAKDYLAGSISIVGPSVRVTHAKLREYAPIIKEYANKISRELSCPNTVGPAGIAEERKIIAES